MEIIGEISKMPATIQSLAKRSVNLFPPIAKDCTHRLLVNKVTWVIIAILLLPCILGLVIYYETNNDRQVQEIDGEKIYYTNDGALIHEEKREDYQTIHLGGNIVGALSILLVRLMSILG